MFVDHHISRSHNPRAIILHHRNNTITGHRLQFVHPAALDKWKVVGHILPRVDHRKWSCYYFLCILNSIIALILCNTYTIGNVPVSTQDEYLLLLVEGIPMQLDVDHLSMDLKLSPEDSDTMFFYKLFRLKLQRYLRLPSSEFSAEKVFFLSFLLLFFVISLLFFF